jgi:transaldolase
VPDVFLDQLKTKIYADGADLAGMLELAQRPYIKGFTTNPTLMRKAGVADYAGFAREVLAHITDRPVSFEVFSDDEDGIWQQAREIASWAPNVYVKVPVTDCSGRSLASLIRRLSGDGVQVNVTALLTLEQVRTVTEALADGAPSYVSVFAGRIADTGRDPIPIMREALAILRAAPRAELIWASPREVLNVVQASDIRCDIITVTSDVLAKLPLLGKALEEFSLDTVRMFFEDARSAGYELRRTEVGA